MRIINIPVEIEARDLEASRDFVYQKFCEYYRNPSNVIPAPIFAEQREFGYLMFKERFMVRHKRFKASIA